MDVDGAIEELVRSSFVERVTASDNTIFLDVAFVASVFGRRKLEVTPMKAAIDADVEFLQLIGATGTSALRHGVRPRVERLFQNIARRLALSRIQIESVVPSLEFVCRRYPRAWLMLAKLHEEAGGPNSLEHAAECLRRFLEYPQDVSEQRVAWDELGRLYVATNNWMAAAQAYIRGCKLPDTPFSTVSNSANWLNNQFREHLVAIDSEERRLLIRELAQRYGTQEG